MKLLNSALCRAIRSAVTIGILLLLCAGNTNALGALPLSNANKDNTWEMAFLLAVSSDGKWVSYKRQRGLGSEADTFRLRNTKSSKEYVLSRDLGNGGEFSSDSEWFGHSVRGGGVEFVNLKAGTVRKFKDSTKFSFAANGRALLVGPDNTGKMGADQLLVVDLESNRVTSLGNVKEYSLDQGATKVAYIARRGLRDAVEVVNVLEPSDNALTIPGTEGTLSSIAWSEDALSFAFIEAVGQPGVEGKTLAHVYDTKERAGKAYRLALGSESNLSGVMNITKLKWAMTKGNPMLLVSSQPMPRPERSVSETEPRPTVQVFGSQDEPSPDSDDEVYAWWPEDNELIKLANGRGQFVSLVGDAKFALIVDDRSYRPTFEFDQRYVDLYIVNVADGSRKIISEKQALDNVGVPLVSISPSGDRIALYRDRAWWVHNVKTNKRTNVSAGIKLDIDGIEVNSWSTSNLQFRPYAGPAWMEERDRILVNDKYDVWSVPLDGSEANRITKGREEQRKYRVQASHFSGYWCGGSCGNIGRAQSFEQWGGIPMSIFGETSKSSGYLIWKNAQDQKVLAFGDMRVDGLLKAAQRDMYVYSRERYDLPPEIVVVDAASSRSRVLAKSEGPKRKSIGKAVLVDYVTPSGKSLQGSLYYPTNYRKGAKHPMIVHIYEDQSNGFNKYLAPMFDFGTGFDIPSYTSNGYFVFLPDISYDKDRVGFSALDSVTSAVSKVLSRGDVDPERIGLYGHSFGGYETLFIISQTDMFAVAVAGAALFDLPSFYLSQGFGGQPNYSRFEGGQWRFSGPLHEMYEAYELNSPLFHANKINTPLLSWAGDKDMHIGGSAQGFELYHSLRRMHKPHVFLVYEGEQHLLSNPVNQADLNTRTREWFDYYLKDSDPAQWIRKQLTVQ